MLQRVVVGCLNLYVKTFAETLAFLFNEKSAETLVYLLNEKSDEMLTFFIW